MDARAPVVLAPGDLAALVQVLHDRGSRVVGPVVRDGAVVLDDLETVDDLPQGWGDEQEPARYRLRRRDDGAWFGFAVGPHAAKRFLYPPRRRLWRATRTPDGVRFEADEADGPPVALVGLRACDLAAVRVHDRVLASGAYADAGYVRQRDRAFLVAVDCHAPAATCFCAPLGTGPHATSGFDIALTELLDGDGHRFVGRAGTDGGAALLAEVASREATDADLAAVRRQEQAARAAQARSLDTADLPDVLARTLEAPTWDDVAARCLACTNCTMVCPTCFCQTVEDTTDLGGDTAERWRRWDSCFTEAFSHLHGGPVRASTRARYRQWLTHKLGSWVAQFGEPGCIGCGRCITWCPAAIDITAEAAAVRAYDTAVTSGGRGVSP